MMIGKRTAKIIKNGTIHLLTTHKVGRSLPKNQLLQYIETATLYLPITKNSPLRGKNILVVLGRDSDIKRIKKTFWGRPQVSDVVSFCYEDPPLVEIIINVDQAKRQAPWTLIQEIVFLYIHGLLHILGYEDNTSTKRSRMLFLGRKILDKVRF